MPPILILGYRTSALILCKRKIKFFNNVTITTYRLSSAIKDTCYVAIGCILCLNRNYFVAR